MAHSVEVAKGTVHLALAAVIVGLAEAVAVLVVTERGAVGGAGALLGAVHSKGARGTGVTVARHVVATMADGAVAQRVAALAVSVHIASEGEDASHYMIRTRRLSADAESTLFQEMKRVSQMEGLCISELS